MTSYFDELLTKTAPGNNPVLPADFGRVAQGVWRNLFFPGETITLPIGAGFFTDQPTAPTQAIASWEVRNYAGVVVASGGSIAPGTPLTVPPLPLGWYRVYFSRSSSIAKWGTSAGGGMFAVVRPDVADMRPRPTAPDNANGNNGFYDQITRGMIGSAPSRMSIHQNPASQPSSDSFGDVDAALAANQTNILAYDPARPKPTVVAFPDVYYSDTSQTANVSAVSARYTAVDYFEATNEPAQDANLAAAYSRFRTMVKAGRASAKVCGPCPVVIGSAEVDANIRQFFTAGGGNHLDAISWHQYNGINGDLMNGRKTLDNWVAFLAEFGQQNKPRFVTEAGHYFAQNYGASTPRRQANWALLDLMMLEQYGVPKEHYMYYYDISGGYDGQPGHMITRGGLPFPVIPLLRVYGQELVGAPYESRLDFGTTGNHLAVGSTFRRADGTGVAVLMAPGTRAYPVTAQLPQSVTSVEVVDEWGNVTTKTVTGGLLTLTAGILPTYVRLPAGATFTVVDPAFGTNLAAGRTPTATSNPGADLAKVTNSEYENPYHYNWPQGSAINSNWNIWQSAPGTPQTVTVPLAAPSAVSCVVLFTPPPHQQMTRPLDYDIQVQRDGAWATVATYTDAPTVVEWRSTGYDAANAFTETYDDEHHNHVVRFDRQADVTAVRAVVRGVTHGNLPTLAAATAHGLLDNQGAGIYPAQSIDVVATGPRLMLQEVEVYDAAAVTESPDEEPPPDAPAASKYVVRRIT